MEGRARPAAATCDGKNGAIGHLQAWGDGNVSKEEGMMNEEERK